MRNIDNYKITNILPPEENKDYIDTDESVNEDELFTFVELNEKQSEHLAAEPYSYWKSVFRAFIKKPGAVISLISLAIFLACILIIPPLIDMELVSNARDSIYRDLAPSSEFWFGTDTIGRDMFALVFIGARKSIILALISSGIVVVIGTLVGLVWGYFKKLDPLFVELYNLISNIPGLLLYMLLGTIFREALPTTAPEIRLIVSLSLFGWLGLARFIRNQVIIINNRDYNIASITLGTPPFRMMIKNLLPYILAVVITETSLIIPGMVSSEVTMSYFGVGLPNTAISIGAVLESGTHSFKQYPWQLLAPAFMLAWIIFTFFLMGISLSDALDPKKHR